MMWRLVVLMVMMAWAWTLPPPVTSSSSMDLPCFINALGLVCDFLHYHQVQQAQPKTLRVAVGINPKKGATLDLEDWPEVKEVFIYNGHRLKILRAICKKLNLYNTTTSFFREHQICYLPFSTRTVKLEYSQVDRIPGTVHKLEIFHSKLNVLALSPDLREAYISNSNVSLATFESVCNAEIQFVDSTIGKLKGAVIGNGASLTFTGSNVTIPNEENLVVNAGGALTIHSSSIFTTSSKAVKILPGGKLSVISSRTPLYIMGDSGLQEANTDRPPLEDIFTTSAASTSESLVYDQILINLIIFADIILCSNVMI